VTETFEREFSRLRNPVLEQRFRNWIRIET